MNNNFNLNDYRVGDSRIDRSTFQTFETSTFDGKLSKAIAEFVYIRNTRHTHLPASEITFYLKSPPSLTAKRSILYQF